MMKPDFIIVGAPRAGTSALYYFLNQHPEIFMSPVKEPAHFSNYGLEDYSNQEKYLELFDGADNEQLTGEASPMYLWDPFSSKKINETNGHTKIIAILRDPVDRAWSHYKQNKMIGLENLTFKQAIRREERSGDNLEHYALNYCGLGHYKIQLKRYFSKFRQEQIKVLNFDNLFNNLPGSFAEVTKFLGVKSCLHEIDFKIINQSTSYKIPVLQKIIAKDSRLKYIIKKVTPDNLRKNIRQKFNWWNRNNQKKNEIKSYDIQLIRDKFTADILYIKNKLDFNVSHWESNFS